MTYPRLSLGAVGRHRRAVSASGAELLNARWHKPHGMTRSRRCTGCGHTLADAHRIHQGGGAYHRDCAPYAVGLP